MSEAQRTQLLGDLGTHLDLVPPDDDEKQYSTSDERVTQDHVDAIIGLALAMAARIADTQTGYATELLTVCGNDTARAAVDDACLTKVLQYYGRKAFRRPLSSDEVNDFKAYYQTAKTQGLDGLGAMFGRLVGHPNFYYRLDDEGEKADGTEAKDALYKLDRWELLSKLTFLFWAAPPTDALYDFVTNVDITEDDGLRKIVDTVLADPKAEQGVLAFFREWLLLDDTPNPATAGNVLADKTLVARLGLDALPPTQGQDMIQEILDLVGYYALQTDGKFEDVLTSPYSFARTPALAQVYGVQAWDGHPDHLVTLPGSERSGLLSRAAFVAASGEYTRPIIKGKRILTRVLCQSVSPPPPGLDIKPVDLSPTKTTRQATEEATSAALCQSCHLRLNGLGFITENYDPLGHFRQKELRFKDMAGDVLAELDVNTQSSVRMADGSTKDVAGAVAFAVELAKSGDAHDCLAQNYFQFLSGRSADPTVDACAVTALRDSLSGPQGSIKNMLRASALAPSFRYRKIQ